MFQKDINRDINGVIKVTQLLNFKDQVCKRLETMLHEETAQGGTSGEKPKPQKIVQVRRYDIFPVKRLTSCEDVDGYVEISKNLK